MAGDRISFLVKHLKVGLLCFTAVAMIGTITAVVLGVMLRGSFLHALVIGLLFFVGVISTLAWLTTIVFAIGWRLRSAYLASWILLGLCVALLLQVPGYFLGNVLLERDIRTAKAYCESLIPDLKAYHAKHGVYPEGINPMLVNTPPRLLRDYDFYGRYDDGQKFSFDFINPGGIFNGFEYYSSKDRWYEWD